MTAPAAPTTDPAYQQAGRPVPQRVADLLRRMTLDEKVGRRADRRVHGAVSRAYTTTLSE